MRRRMRPEQDSARRTKSGDGYENIEAWGWGGGVLGSDDILMVWYIFSCDLKFAAPLQSLIPLRTEYTRKH